MRPPSRIELMLLLAIVLWALNLSVSRYILTNGFLPLPYSVVRYGLAAVVFAAIGLVAERSLRLRGRDLGIALAAAGVLYVNQLGFVYALKTTSASVIAMILAATPIVAALIGVVLGRERLHGRFWVGAGLSFAGVAVVSAAVGGALEGSLLGVLLGLLTAATWAVYSILVTPLMQRHSATRISATVLAATWVPLALTATPQLADQDWSLGPEIWALLLFATLGPLVLTNVLWFRSLDEIGPARATLATNLQPFVAAAALVVVKLATGLAAGSLGLVAEAAHSGTDLVAALLTFFAVGYAAKPADDTHLYGHGKAEHLAALAEAAFLVLVSVLVAGLAVARLGGWIETEVDPAWWAFAAAGIVIAIDVMRTVSSLRASRRHRSAALMSNALHFGSDLAGTLAVVAGLAAAAAGFPAGDSLAALFVSALVVVAGIRLMRRNVDVLMDRAPAGTVEVAQAAIATLEPPVDLRRVRLREAGGRAFADVVIGVSPGAVVGQGHATADRVERALERSLPGIDVVVHVEPQPDGEAALLERVRAAAAGVSHVREIHDLALIDTAAGVEVSLHLKLPPELPLVVAHARAEAVERAIRAAVPGVAGITTHIEPLTDETPGAEVGRDARAIERAVQEATGEAPRSTRVLETPQGLVVLVTLPVDGDASLREAHAQAHEVVSRVRAAVPDVHDVIVHTEP